jgi:hypothetical protein
MSKRKAETQVPEGMKFCNGCKKNRTVDDFRRKSDRPCGRGSRCKECDKGQRQQQASENLSKLAMDPDALGATCECRRCHGIFPRNEFNDNLSRKNGKVSYCKICEAAKNLLRKMAADQDRLQWFKKQGGCVLCRETNPKYLEAAHIDRKTKVKNPSQMAMFSQKRRKAEYAKCVCLCMEHHSRETAKENGECHDESKIALHDLTRAEKARRSKCAHCARAYDPSCPEFFHFDHLRASEKVEAVSMMVTRCRPKEMIIAEMKKCQMLCGHCHNDVTATRRQDKWQIWIQSLGQDKEDCLGELARDWDMDEDEIGDIIDDRHFRRDVFESAHGKNWIDFIKWV